MPRYFFHVVDGRALIDAEGVELTGVDEARKEAIRTAGQMLADAGKKFWKCKDWQMTVADAAGDSVLTLRFSADDHGK